MPLIFDATLKQIVGEHPADFDAALRLGGPEPTRALNVDLSTVTAATDVLLGHGDPLESATDLNFQTGPDENFDRRVALYNVLAHNQLRVPIHSVAVLLRPAADSPPVRGHLRYVGRPRRGRMSFKYEVVRMWKQPLRRFLRGGLGALPLATLCRFPEGVTAAEAVADVVRRINERLMRETTPERARSLLAACYLLTGLRVSRQVAEDVFRRYTDMHDSTTVQGLLDDGAILALRRLILRQGAIRFGPPSEATTARVNALKDLERLERWADRIATATSWEEVLRTR